MKGVAYVNGVYAPLRAARVSVQDRGFQFGDGVYEVWPIRDGGLVDTGGHMARLIRSLNELRIVAPMRESALWAVLREVIRRNRVRNGIAYVQVTRGAARTREHNFPAPPAPPSVVVTAKALDAGLLNARAEQGVRVIAVPETRWARRDIKSVNLLANVLARQAAKEAGAFEAWFVDADGLVTEGTSSSAFIVDAKGAVRTRPLSQAILHGVTRAAIADIARAQGLEMLESPFSVDEAKSAREAFITHASNAAVPVIAIDDVLIANGRPGPVVRALRAAYLRLGVV